MRAPPVTPLFQTGMLLAAAFVAGGVNSIAGGGSLLVFPALLATGLPPLTANGTNTVALVPGSVAGFLGHRQHLAGSRAWAVAMALPSLLGAVIGTALALRTGDSAFAKLVPWLVLGATALFALNGPLQKRFVRGDAREVVSGRGFVGVAVFQLLVSVYGGFFGAGIGIVMLAALGLLGHRDIHRMNGLKNLAAAAINAVSSVAWIVAGRVHGPYAVMMGTAAVAGGFVGSRLANRVGPVWVRRMVTAVGVTIGTVMLVRQLMQP